MVTRKSFHWLLWSELGKGPPRSFILSDFYNFDLLHLIFGLLKYLLIYKTFICEVFLVVWADVSIYVNTVWFSNKGVKTFL